MFVLYYIVHFFTHSLVFASSRNDDDEKRNNRILQSFLCGFSSKFLNIFHHVVMRTNHVNQLEAVNALKHEKTPFIMMMIIHPPRNRWMRRFIQN